MKNYVLVILLFLSPALANAQKTNAREIAKAALQKMTGGKRLTSFELEITYDKPRENPVELTQPNAFLMLMDSIMPTLPDSVQKSLMAQRDSIKISTYLDRIEMFKGMQERILCDVANQKVVFIRLIPNSLRNYDDTLRNVSGIVNEFPFQKPYTENPVYLLQLMVADSTELHYSGSSFVDQEESHIIQVKIDGKWVDTYITKKSHLLTRLVLQRVDTDPLIGHGPEYYKDCYLYSDYQRVSGILLPKSLEEITSRGDLTVRKRLDWKSINKSFPDDTFKPEPTYEERARFKIVPLRDSLYVVIQSGNKFSHRSLVRLNAEKTLDIFMEPINHEAIAEKFFSTISAHFTQTKIRNVFCSGSISSIAPLPGLLDKNTQFIAPKGNGFLSEERQFALNSEQDSIRKLQKAKGLLITFDQNLVQNDVKAYVINPEKKEEWDELYVFYYLPRQKLVFYKGSPYWAIKNSKQLSPAEKRLYEYLFKEKIQVEEIIYSESFVDEAPLEMTFQDLVRRANSE
jgi:hypothetical protein